ncbi:hypothetical protein MKX03_004849 [Papaver bracteatum]|nr:hypothetical protein MKX03_004849 [Papaver bracteatum]
MSSSSILLLFLFLLSISPLISYTYAEDIGDILKDTSTKIAEVLNDNSKEFSDGFRGVFRQVDDGGKHKSRSNGPRKIVIPLEKFRKIPFVDIWKRLSHIAEVSLSRAHRLKHKPKVDPVNATGVFPKSYGEYSISLSFGTPPQAIPLIMDTGSEIVWLPCTKEYTCIFCNSTPVANPLSAPDNMIKYEPLDSESFRQTTCDHPGCTYIQGRFTCKSCKPTNSTRSNCLEVCPRYALEYGSGMTNGTLLSDTLTFGDIKISDFVFGCSNFTFHIPAGIAGFGRGISSIPAQLGLRKFSYCLLSKTFNDTTKSSPLVLYDGSDSEDEDTDGINHTPFLQGPKRFPYYYIGLEKITVGGKKVQDVDEFITLHPNGSGGTIIDSGATFSFMGKQVYDKVVQEIDSQAADYKRAANVEKDVHLSPCYEVPKENASLPELGFHFRGGVKMDLPVMNTFWFIDTNETRVACLAVVTDRGKGGGGPAVILGNFQQQNYYVEYDLKHEHLGFRTQDCSED